VSAIGPIGIDVERHNPGRRHDRLAERAFGPAERASAARLGDVGFYRVWTLREAISKATGEGMALAADSIDRIPQPFLDGAFTEGAWVAGADGWVMAAMALAHDLSLAVAIQASTAASLPARRLEELRIAL
jgi:phosphopantetheinyl transferase